ncbi:PREDICTED: protein arginine N-methyltransferase 3-like isoform X2 [Priapulus caudatus]|uniref:type I protein arginine methyltransferase n=1 Tax=Priapulus caudatus TaxID=37621 RepID=A0ABM1EK19_PRICU|nr:PREDICTED: protein arginine N-methyltransferase 3-like isoform X2 [Priapulus caudatus]
MAAPSSCDNQVPDMDEVSDSGDEEDWEECNPEPMATTATCLFCEQGFNTVDDMYCHCNVNHNFDITSVVQRFHLDDFSYIKMINYIRKEKPSVDFFGNEGCDGTPWCSESYLKPVIEDDAALQFDIEDISVSNGDHIQSNPEAVGRTGDNKNTTPGSEEEVTVPRVKYHALISRLEAAERNVAQLQEQLCESQQKMDKMRTCVRDIVLPCDEDAGHAASSSSSSVQRRPACEDLGYFSAYAHHGIHEEMLKDKVRTLSYRRAVMSNAAVFRDAVVLDVGCGTGILSMFAARAGARRVIAVDMSDVVYQAMDIVRENKLEHIITVIRGKVEEVSLPVDKVDIIISEWMGYFLLFESMLDSVLYARDKWLTPNGHMFPNLCSISLAAVGNVSKHQEHIGFWNDVYDFKMSCMVSIVEKEAVIETVGKDDIMSNSAVVKELDLKTCSVTELDFSSEFLLTACRKGVVTAITGFFDIRFDKDLQEPVSFSTSAADTPTHWKQTLFYLREPIPVCQGEVIRGNVQVLKDPKDPRSLLVTLSVNGRTFNYTMD